MPITNARFVWSIGDGIVLIPRTTAIAAAYHELFVANLARLAASSPTRLDPTPESTLGTLERSGRDWLDGTRLPLAIGIAEDGGHRLVGATSLAIDSSAGSAELGFWVDAAVEGRGLVRRVLGVVLDHAFNDLGLHRVEMRTLTTNDRSWRLAERLGFTLEGVLRGAIRFPDGYHDVAVYALLAGMPLSRASDGRQVSRRRSRAPWGRAWRWRTSRRPVRHRSDETQPIAKLGCGGWL